MKKIDAENIIKISIFICFSVYFIYLIISKKLYIYIHPRLMPVIIISIVIMILIILCMINYIPDKSIKRNKTIRCEDYAFFLIPIIAVFFIETNTIKAANKESSIGEISNQTDNIKKDNTNNTIMKNSEQGYKKITTLDISENTININSNNFIFSLNEILDNPEKYKNYTININGFIYRDKTLKQNEFVIGRHIMVCCAADMQVAGVICEYNENELYDNYTWVKAKGKICTRLSDGSEEVYISVQSMEEDKNPDTSYVYPY